MKIPQLSPTKTILTITVGFLILHLITKIEWFIYLGMAIGIVGLVSPYLAKKITLLWSGLGGLLSLIVPNILLSLVFFFILFPIALLSKAFGNSDPLQLKDNLPSMFKDRDNSFEPGSFEKMW